MKVQGKFKLQAHKISGVVMDVAAFKVRHSLDMDAAALRAARASSSFIGAMEERSGQRRRLEDAVASFSYTLVLVSVVELSDVVSN